MKQKNGRSICVQILQTLNILFENIRNETSLCKYIFYIQLTLFIVYSQTIFAIYSIIFALFATFVCSNI
jgi:hypothetical protein